MDLVRLWALVFAIVAVVGQLDIVGAGNVVLKVQNKFAGREKSLSALKAHDSLRRGRLLSAVGLELGGSGHPAEAGLYFAKIGIGTPSSDYYVQVDTGSDIFWVNCAGCNNCPRKSDLGIKLTMYDPKGSSTGDLVTCDQDFCTSMFGGHLHGCKPGLLCPYNVAYGDGSQSTGYFVKDNVHFDRVTGNFVTAPANGTVIFGCGFKQSGQLGSSSVALDGILGFGQANSSVLSQLASAGKVKKMFAHCLDSVRGGGIFAIGEVVSTKVNTTPIVPNQAHYNVVMKALEVGGDILDLPTNIFDSRDEKGIIIDSGTTLAYLPEVVYDSLMTQIMSHQPGLKLHIVEDQFSCFKYNGNVDEGFPDVVFHFEGSLTLTVYPHDYLFQIREDAWCIGWQSGGAQSKDGTARTLLGDLVLSNRLVIYDLENQTIGWKEYNCSSSIKVRDENTGGVYSVGAHDLSSASSLINGSILPVLWLLTFWLHSFT